MLNNVAEALPLLFSLDSFSFLLFGLIIGFIFGALPGLSSANACALILPLSIGMELHVALFFMVGIYCGAQYAGAIPAILFNTPGTAGSAATALDGYQMCLRGEADKAIGIARMASALGGVFAGLIVIVMIGPISKVALSFGPLELFLTIFLGLIIISAALGDNLLKALFSASLGFLIAAMGADAYYGRARVTFGLPELFEGVSFIPVIIGLFAITEMFFLANKESLVGTRVNGNKSGGFAGALSGISETFKAIPAVLRAGVIGMFLGILPGIGTAVANFISYGLSKRLSKHPEEFGKGSVEGVIASEACDNGVTAGSMVPALTLGIPGSTTSAIILSAFYLHGIQPGPRIMAEQSVLVYAILLGIIMASILILPIGILITAPLAKIVSIKPKYLVSVIILLAILGAYAVNNSLFDVGVAFLFGVLGVFFRMKGIPVVPLVIGLILGPMAEGNFVKAYLLSNGEWSYFFSSKLSIGLWVLIVVLLVKDPLVKLGKRIARSK